MTRALPAALFIALALGAFTAPGALAQDAKATATVMPVAPPADVGAVEQGIELDNRGQRWWMVNLVWRAQRKHNRLPQKHLQRR